MRKELGVKSQTSENAMPGVWRGFVVCMACLFRLRYVRRVALYKLDDVVVMAGSYDKRFGNQERSRRVVTGIWCLLLGMVFSRRRRSQDRGSMYRRQLGELRPWLFVTTTSGDPSMGELCRLPQIIRSGGYRMLRRMADGHCMRVDMYDACRGRLNLPQLSIGY
jgi:hypothetical protein